MRLLLFLLFLITSSVFAKEAKNEDPLIYLTWQHDPTSTMTIQWITSSKNIGDTLYYHPLEKSPTKKTKKKKKEHWKEVTGMHRTLPQGLEHIVHRVELQNLQPDTVYIFRFHPNSKQQYRFRTMPLQLNSPVRFVVGGDAYHSSFKRFREMTTRAGKANPRFAIIGGDIAYGFPSKDKREKKEDDFEKWQGFFSCWMHEMVDAEGCFIPLFVTIGNHEVKGGFHRTREDAPLYYTFFERSSYDFGFGNYAHFTFLDSGHTRDIDGEQTEWLNSVLQTSRHFLHRFVAYHVAAFPSTGDFDFHYSKKIRKHWVPLFEKYHIDASFESHDHAYKRTHPLIDGKMHPQGILYFGDGSWGVKPRVPKERPYLARAAQSQQILVVELSREARKFLSVDPDGNIIDNVEQPTRIQL